MSESLFKFVHQFRAAIYILIFLVVIGLTIHNYLKAEEPKIESPQTFWPPDMVPHPHPPQPPPQDDLA